MALDEPEAEAGVNEDAAAAAAAEEEEKKEEEVMDVTSRPKVNVFALVRKLVLWKQRGRVYVSERARRKEKLREGNEVEAQERRR